MLLILAAGWDRSMVCGMDRSQATASIGSGIHGKVFCFCTAFCTVSALVSLSKTGFASACVA